ncbi:MAG: serine hydrolase domain-containing protein [Myxococcota bacterium]
MGRSIAWFFVVGSLHCADPSEVSLRSRIETVLREELQATGVASLQVAVAFGNNSVIEAAVGYADLENRVPAAPSTRYRSASISKWFTATATMKLASQGKLDLDATVQSYCDDFPNKGAPITVRQLLTHRSGLRHYVDYAALLERAESEADKQVIERRSLRSKAGACTRYVDRVTPLENFKDDPLESRPGTAWRYTSFGYRLLGCVLESASGANYSLLMEQEVFSPAKMRHTVADDAWAIIESRASGYRVKRDGTIRRADMRDVSENLPAGGHLTTATDLVSFAVAFHRGELVDTQTRGTMIDGLSYELGDAPSYDSWRLAVPAEPRYAYGVMSFPNENDPWYGHTGRQAGGSGIVVLVPDKNLAVAALTNTKGWNGYLDLTRKLVELVGNETGSP